MTQETRELFVRALRKAADAWEAEADNTAALMPESFYAEYSPNPAGWRNTARRNAAFCRGFAEALENGCSL